MRGFLESFISCAVRFRHSVGPPQLFDLAFQVEFVHCLRFSNSFSGLTLDPRSSFSWVSHVLHSVESLLVSRVV